jgi:hypothetical protein
VRLQSSKASASYTLKVADGWIAGYDEGEFGGAVYWFSLDGKIKMKLSDVNINEFIVDGSRIFAVTGLAHLNFSEGSMVEILKVEGEWTVVEFVPLPDSGEAIARVGVGDYVIVTSTMLLRVNLKKEMRILIANKNWGILYPNSIAVDDKNIYIGMRKYVVRCNLASNVQSFDCLVPNSK